MLRRHLWNRVRQAELTPAGLPSPQNQIVNWLRAQVPSAVRNRLLQYFEAGPIAGPDLKELRQIWHSRLSRPETEWMGLLEQFVAKHPAPPASRSDASRLLAPEREEDLVCVAWMLLL